MLTEAVTLSIIFVSLFVVLGYAFASSYRKKSSEVSKNEIFSYVSAVDSQTALPLAWSLFASGMGSWVLFAFPEIGTFSGAWGMIGYTLSMCLPLGILAIVGPILRGRILGVAWSDYLATVITLHLKKVTNFFSYYSATVDQFNTTLQPFPSYFSSFHYVQSLQESECS